MSMDLATKLSAITDYYGAGTIWDRMSIDGLSPEQINAMYNALPAQSFTIDMSASGTVLGRQYANPFELPVQPGLDFDSNLPGGSYSGGNTFSGSVPANIITDPNTGLPVRQTAGAVRGASTIAAVADRVTLAVAGVNLGAKLGLKIDETLYNLAPDWWDEHLPTVNPETWNSLVGVNPVGDFFLRTLFGIENNIMTGYISADAIAYYYQMLRDNGAWGDGHTNYNYTGDTSRFPYPQYTHVEGNQFFTVQNQQSPFEVTSYQVVSSGNSTMVADYNSRTNTDRIQFYSDDPNAYVLQTNTSTGATNIRPITGTRTTYNNTTFYIANPFSFNRHYYLPYELTVAYDNSYPNMTIEQIGTILFDGTVIPSGIDGITTMPDSLQYPPTNITGTTPQQVKQQLRDEYPDLFDGSITESTLQPDGTVTETEYLPIPWVVTGTDDETATTDETRTQTDTEVDPETAEQVLPTSTTTDPPDPPDTGDGSTSVPPLPTGSASSLWAVYNPTQGEVNAFGAWLWNSNFVEQLKKLFSDPMQAIIGIHKVFATPSTGGSQTIKCGYLDSGVSSRVVTNQYTSVDCGTVNLREYFGNVFDYEPYTKVSIFLPFIGIVPLDVEYIMRSSISVSYKVDVITGACLANITVNRDGFSSVIFTYSGSAIVSYPVSSGSYVGVISGAMSILAGVAGTIASGGSALPATMGALSGLGRMRTNVQHSGQFSGCAGAMGIKVPYLIISRPQTRMANEISKFSGYPSNNHTIIGSCEGFTQVESVHLEIPNAYSNELDEIERLLKTGIII